MSLISLESPPGKVRVVQESPAPLNRQTNPARRILVVEDDQHIRHIYASVLARAGYQVDTAEDGEAGWEALHSVGHDPDSYDLLITDNVMPKLSGVELIQKLRSARLTLPVILASGTIPSNTDRLQLAAILTKPFPPHLLVQTVSQVLHASISGQATMCGSQAGNSHRLSAQYQQGIGQSPLHGGMSPLTRLN